MKQEDNAYAAYCSLIDRILLDIEREDQQAIRRVIELLHEARSRRIEKLAAEERGDIYHLAVSGMLIEKWLPYFEGRCQFKSWMQQWEPYEWDSFLTEQMLERLQRTLQLVDLSPYQLMVLQAYEPHPIHGLVGNALKNVNRALIVATLGEKTPFQLMTDITEILGDDGIEAIGGVSYRAETITRTELGRITSIATFAQQKEAAKVIPGLMKEWRSALLIDRTRGSPGTTGPYDHWSAHGQRAPVNEPFIVSGEELMYPLDPAGSPGNTMNCMCISILHHPNWEMSIRGTELPEGHIGIIREK